jgi:hypothetical protein
MRSRKTGGAGLSPVVMVVRAHLALRAFAKSFFLLFPLLPAGEEGEGGEKKLLAISIKPFGALNLEL